MKKVELLQPHTHAGRDYPPGSELTLDDDAAAWLIALRVAQPAVPAKTTGKSADKETVA